MKSSNKQRTKNSQKKKKALTKMDGVKFYLDEVEQLLTPRKFWIFSLPPKGEVNALLHKAAKRKHKEVIELLISKGANVNAVNGNGYTPLYIATENNHQEVIEVLISKGANINVAEEYGHTPLHLATENNNKEIIELLISKGAEVNATQEFGATPLHLASFYCPKEIVELLILKGADVNAMTEDGGTPLHIASLQNKNEIIELLISRGANVNAVSEVGLTPLHTALQNEQKGILSKQNKKTAVELLISKGADVNAIAKDGGTPLHYTFNYTAAIEMLNDADREPGRHSKLDWDGIVGQNEKEITELLINSGADVNAINKEGSTPLHRASIFSNKGIVELLIAKGANVLAVDTDGQTPLEIASLYDHQGVIELLNSRQTDANNNSLMNVVSNDLVKSENVELKQQLRGFSANNKYDERFWVITCNSCNLDFIIGVNVDLVCWEEIYTQGNMGHMLGLGESEATRENLIGNLQANGDESDLIINSDGYKPIPNILTDNDLYKHQHESSLLLKAINSGQKRCWNCNFCNKINSY